ncbi:MAG TPA: orotate phosphoribosyltransferase [Acidobacteriaceae bacterium]|nr:orotate phosphoribosyltransferase [Acidobacteriaceae bacterium]
MSEVVASALLSVGGVSFRPDDPITFKSGILSPVYCDNRRFPFHPREWRQVIEGFVELMVQTGVNFDVIGGIEAAGIPHSATLGFVTATPSVFIRKAAKEHGTKRRVEGGDVTGRTVLLIEDLVTTGSSSLAGVEALRAEGAVVTDCLAIVSYRFREAMEQFQLAGVQLHTLTSFGEVLELARKRQLVSDAESASVAAWLHDPHGWAADRVQSGAKG